MVVRAPSIGTMISSRAELRASLGAYPLSAGRYHSGAVESSSPSADQLGMSLKLGLNQHQVVRGVELAMINHRKEMADKAIQSLQK